MGNPINEVHRAAKKYVDEWQCSVIPLEAQTKRPPEGFSVMPYKSRRPDDGELNEWFGDDLDRGVGILCGGISGGLLALDVDDPDKFAVWIEVHPELARTRRQKTRRGYHLLFYLRNGATAPSDTAFYLNEEPIGEIKWKGYIIAEPSIHPDTSRREHRWINPEDPILEIESWETLGLGKDAANTERHDVEPNGKIPKGRRNNTLTSLAGTMRARGMTIQAVKAAILAENEARCDPPLTDKELETTIFTSLQTWEAAKPLRLGERLRKETAELMARADLPWPDPELREKITDIIRWRSQEGEKQLKDDRREMAGGLLLGWLCDHGTFIRSRTDSRLCYFHSREKQLLNLETNEWRAWLYGLCGCNPAGTDFAYLDADCRTMALCAEERDVVKVAAWDKDAQVLRVSRFDGAVYVLDGERITQEDNGEHALFDDASWWQPYTPNLERTSGTALRWATEDIAWFEDKYKMHALGYRVWVLTTFFSELCPTRPLLVFLGEKGSGKTMMLRIFMQLLFGPSAQVTGVPDKPDGFTAAASANHILVLDNLDHFTVWLRDKLAMLATGGTDQCRRLYTTNEVLTVRYRCWLAFTARTPDTLKRDDLADRLLLLPTRAIPDDQRQPERHFLEQVEAIRDDWWGDVLLALNGIVASIRRGGLAITSELRMADWESLGRLVAKNEGQEHLWEEFVRHLKLQQSGFLLSDDPLVEGLDQWIKNPENHGRKVKARELHSELAEILFGDKHRPKDWPSTTSGFGKKLAGIRQNLRTVYKVEWGQERNYCVYQFWPLEEESPC